MSEKIKKSELFDPNLGNCQTPDSCRNGRFCQAASVASFLSSDDEYPCTHPQLQRALVEIKRNGDTHAS